MDNKKDIEALIEIAKSQNYKINLHQKRKNGLNL